MKKFYRIFATSKVSEDTPELCVLYWYEDSLRQTTIVDKDDVDAILNLRLHHACVTSNGDYWLRIE